MPVESSRKNEHYTPDHDLDYPRTEFRHIGVLFCLPSLSRLSAQHANNERMTWRGPASQANELKRLVFHVQRDPGYLRQLSGLLPSLKPLEYVVEVDIVREHYFQIQYLNSTLNDTMSASLEELHLSINNTTPQINEFLKYIYERLQGNLTLQRFSKLNRHIIPWVMPLGQE
jgi:hypothetical protein